MRGPIHPRRTPRPIEIVGDAAYLTLTKGFVAVIDKEDADLVKTWNWSASVEKHTVYAVRGERTDRILKMVRLHRVILADPAGLLVDHIDGNGLNNRRNNLRVSNHSENCRNSRLRSDSLSGLKGATWDQRSGEWRAVVKVYGRQKWLGLFDTAEAAHEAYCNAAVSLHGKFARAF